MKPIVQPVSQDCDPVELYRLDHGRYPRLLQSTAQGRFDILFAFPGESLVLDAAGYLQSPGVAPDAKGDFLDSLDRWWQERCCPANTDPAGLPFTGGWFIYLGYELAGWIEPCLQLPPAADGLPVAIATRFSAAVIRDRLQATTWIVAEPEQQEQVRQIAADITALARQPPLPHAANRLNAIRESEPQDYLQAVRRILEYIREGDVFQVNLSRQWDIDFDEPVDPVQLYRQLCIHNPAPFSGLADLNDAVVISSSPERLVAVKDSVVQTRPIAGTRPRSTAIRVDRAYSRELLAHPKERAEHIMLIDLERNDLGRICVPGSIEVNELMVLESYAHVHHIVSNIHGRLRDDVLPGQVIRAVFPGGTITGCPKVRCMEIIAELENAGRGAYTGSMGYLNRDGSMDLNILIRSMVSQGKCISVRAGAGIVADSDADAELVETRAKARGMLRALGLN